MKNKLVLSVTAVAHSLDHSYILVFAVLLEMMRKEFQMSYAEIGFVGAVLFFLNGLNAIPSGFLSDRIGSKKVVVLSMFLCGLSAVGISFAPNKVFFITFIFFMGIGIGLYHPAGISLVSKLFEKDRSKAMGFHGIGGNIGQTITPTLTGLLASSEVKPILFFTLTGLGLGWRNTYFLWCLPGFLLVLFVFYFVKIKEQNKLEGSIKEVLRKKTIIIVLILTSFQGLYFNGVTAFLPTILEVVKERALIVAGLLFSLLQFSGIFGQSLGGYAGDIYNKKLLLILFNSLSTLSLIILFYSTSTLGVVISVVLLGFSCYAFQPIVNSIVAENIPNNLRGRAYGLTFFTSYGIGGLAPLFAGIVAEIFSLVGVIPLMAVFAFLAILVSFWIK